MLEIPDKQGGVGLRALFAPTDQDERPEQIVAAFEDMVGGIAGSGLWQRGRVNNDHNYLSIDVKVANQEEFNQHLLGDVLTNRGLDVRRVLVFGSECNMTWHHDSPKGHPEAKLFFKYGGSFSREGDDLMDPFSIQYDGVWSIRIADSSPLTRARGLKPTTGTECELPITYTFRYMGLRDARASLLRPERRDTRLLSEAPCGLSEGAALLLCQGARGVRLGLG